MRGESGVEVAGGSFVASATWLPSFPSDPFDPDMSGLDVIPHRDDAARAEGVPGYTPVKEGKGGGVWDARL